ncbi:glutathione binding-like protein [Vibrio barjaei]|jgi:glutathione S-transferase|uniref:glutathione binding-like protein n=1 Tax=Vibrio barjaei TaxID=1676683 RepID=UPI0007BB1045|nr:glutathione binding-like protein [Vibrio barjaei]MCY9873375.1 glutathione binding-like protein [Vibrio barjaei]OIN24154.1 glutathione S-transferase [Vibrio barjaei]
MKLYEQAATVSCKRLNLFLREIDAIGFERVEINVREGDNLSDAYKAKSANGKVPLLELDDGSFLSETVAISRYFDELQPNDLDLFGDSVAARAKVEMWNRIVEIDGIQNAFQAFRNTTGLYKDRENCIEAWGVEAKHRVELFLPKLDKQLSQSDYVATERYTIADISAYIFVVVAINALKIEVLESYPHIKRWFEVVSSRPAMKG